MADIKIEALEAVAGYDEHGVATVFQLAEGEKLPKGFSDTPPKGTHPHEREAAAAHAASAPVEAPPAAETPAETPPEAKAKKPTRSELEEMTKDELVAVADDRDIDLPSHATKADIIDAIVRHR